MIQIIKTPKTHKVSKPYEKMNEKEKKAFRKKYAEAWLKVNLKADMTIYVLHERQHYYRYFIIGTEEKTQPERLIGITWALIQAFNWESKDSMIKAFTPDDPIRFASSLVFGSKGIIEPLKTDRI